MLELMSEENIKDIFNFEILNRAYFEETLPPRPEGYFQVRNFTNIMRAIISEQNEGLCYMHVIRDKNKVIIGRINLSSSTNERGETIWELGYRLDQNSSGKGYGTNAVKEILLLAKDKYNISKVIAGTSTENKASQKVLEKNDFKYIKTIEKDIEINGKSVDTALYIWESK